MRKLFKNLGEIFPKDLAIGSIVYSFTLFQKISWDGSLYVP